MPMINTFGVIGGDERMKYLAQSIAADGYPVCVCGLEKLGTCRGAAECDLPQLAAKSSVILLPLPATKDGLFLNAPYAENEIRLDDDFARLFYAQNGGGGGMLQRLTASSSLWREIEPEDYYRREELAVGNAIPTAEGAVGIAIREYPGTINGAKCLITGFGRIGKNLAIILRGMGAEVFCAAAQKSRSHANARVRRAAIDVPRDQQKVRSHFQHCARKGFDFACAHAANARYAHHRARLRTRRHRFEACGRIAPACHRRTLAARPRRAEDGGGVYKEAVYNILESSDRHAHACLCHVRIVLHI